MGHVKIDTERQARAYAQIYALNTPAGVKTLLRDYHRIGTRRFKGDTAASDILIDLHSAIESAGLSDRQAEAITWVYGLDLSQAQTAEIMRIRPDSVKDLISEAAARIAVIYRKWQYGMINKETTGEIAV